MIDDYNPVLGELEGKALSRLIWQYQNGAKMKAWLTTLPGIAEDELNQAARDIAALINVDEAEGEALNICGRIAQIERPVIPEPTPEDVFYLTDTNDDPPQLGGMDVQMVSVDSAIPIDLQDDVYRRVIRAKIAVNTSDATIDSIASSISQAAGIGTDNVRVIDYQNMSYDVVLLEPIDPIIRFVLTNYPVSPRPQCVKLLGYIEDPEYVQLGAEWQMGDDNAQLAPIYL